MSGPGRKPASPKQDKPTSGRRTPPARYRVTRAIIKAQPYDGDRPGKGRPVKRSVRVDAGEVLPAASFTPAEIERLTRLGRIEPA